MPVALAPFIPFIVGILAAALSTGAYLLLRAIGNALPVIHLPLLGDIKPGDWFLSIGNTVVSWVVHAAEGLFNGVAHWIYGHAYLLEQLAVQATRAIQHLGDQIAHIVSTEIPAVARAAEHELGRAVHSLEQTIAHDATKAADDLAHDLTKVAREIYKAERAVTSHLEHAIKSAAASAVDEAVSEADHAIADLRDYVNGKVRELDRAVADVAGTADTAIDDIARLGRRIDVNSADIAKLLALVGGISLANVLARVESIEGCYVKTCDPTSPRNLLNLLKDLGLIAEFAGAGAFLYEAVEHPDSTANEYSDVIKGILPTAQSDLQALFNL